MIVSSSRAAPSSSTRRPAVDPRLLWDHETCILRTTGGVAAVANRLRAEGRWPPKDCPAFHFPPSGLVRWIQHLRLENEANMDNVVLIDGVERVGKSSLAILIAWLFSSLFRLEKDVAFYLAAEFIHLVDDPEWYRPVLSDEAIASLFNRKSSQPEAIAVITRLFLCGMNRKLIIVLTPNAYSIDPVIRRHRARWWIHVKSRGHAELYEAHRKKIYSKRGEITEPGTVVVWRPVLTFAYAPLPTDSLRKYEAIKKDRYKTEVVRQFAHLAEIEQDEHPYLDLSRK